MFFILGSALTGESTEDTTCLILIGKGAAWKSTLLDLCQIALEIYAFEVKNDLFAQKSTDYNKVLNSFEKQLYIRITILHEIDEGKIEKNRLKPFVQGTAQTTKLFKEGGHEIKHRSKLICTSNTIPNFDTDSGIVRRIRSYEQTSRFTEVDSEIDESKHIYKVNKSLKKDIEDSIELKCAWIDILVQYANEYFKSRSIEYTENFNKSKEIIVGSNNWLQDFIDGNITKTNNDNDRISRDYMRNLISEKYKNRHLSTAQMISLLKDKGLTYDADKRINGIKGCFIGVKQRNNDENINEENNNNAVENNENEIIKIRTYYEELIMKFKNKYSELEKKYNDLENKCVENTKEKNNNKIVINFDD